MKYTKDSSLKHSTSLPSINSASASGLSEEEVILRQNAGLINITPATNTKSYWTIIRENTCTFFNLIFVLLAAALISVGSFKNLAFLMVALCNTAIGIIQEIRAKRAVDKLTVIGAASYPVLRSGQMVQLKSHELLQDDIVEFSAGDQICADAMIASGKVFVDESLLTGEADPVERSVSNELKSGSFILAGSCRARLTHVGTESYAAKLTAEARRNVRAAKSDMMESLSRLIHWVGIALIPMGLLLFVHHYGKAYQAMDLTSATEVTVSALIGMIPEGLFLLTSIAMASACLMLSGKRVLVQDMNCVETLAHVDVLCVDKTGTITEPALELEGLHMLSKKHSIEEVQHLLSVYHTETQGQNHTTAAIAKAFPNKLHWKAVNHIPFSSENKWSATDFGEKGTFILGAPEFILQARYQEIRPDIERLSASGSRILLFASYGANLEKELDPTCVEPLALILLQSILRPNAKETFRYFREQDVSIRVISGDNPITVSAIARRAGIPNAEQYIDATKLVHPEDYSAAAKNYTVFGRVTPDQKRKLIRALKEQGHTVAMTGDGVNDVLALKDSDCSIAMASGSQAASQISQIVLLDSDFSAMPQIVAQGRRVINNIERSASLFLVKNIFSFGLSLILLFINMIYPLQAIQLSLISSLTIGIPGFFLALEPNYTRVQGRFLNNVIHNALPGGLTNLFMLLLVGFLSAKLGLPSNITNTMCVYIVTAVGFTMLYHVCTPFSALRRILFFTLLATGIGAFMLFPGFLELSRLNAEHALLTALLILDSPLVMGILRAILRRKQKHKAAS